METEHLSFEQIVNLAQQLSPSEKIRLIERLTPDIQMAKKTSEPTRRRSLRGILKGCNISTDDIDQARQELWGSLGREDL